MSTAAGLQAKNLGDGVLLELGPPPANIIDQALMEHLRLELEMVANQSEVRFVVIAGAGKHFSYGASVAEHLPGYVDNMLADFHRLLQAMNDLQLPPVAAAVQGRCLGGGFELALACDFLFVDCQASLGCPEIKLGVFPPAGAALLPTRCGAGKASSMVLTGELLSGSQAASCGLAELECAHGSVVETATAWLQQNFASLSNASVRHARRAARWPWKDAIENVLPELERQYLEDLMKTQDAQEGLQAFMEKRAPQWKNQ
ncbi:MAG: cyclohexa-1,5-dienecarbonyl-CoA hydratase [Planctomycetota bacterium]|nr:MAG: cyclohexa-1,5-dienecarbonyl-CoA hydratase [Planctomycetota bacterium]